MASDNTPAKASDSNRKGVVAEDKSKVSSNKETAENLPKVDKNNAVKDQLHPIISKFNNLNFLRQIGLLVGVAASVAIGLSIVFWSQTPSYKPLIHNINELNPREVIGILQENGIDFELNPVSGLLMVRADELHNARLKLAAAGLAEDKNQGFELMDQEQTLGTSQFMEQTRFRRGLEGELGRTIASLQNVRNARVHLAIPKQSVFVRDKRRPSASVLVELYPGRTLEEEHVKSIVNLVSTSVPEMDINDVTVVDQKGNLLSQDEDDPEETLAQKQFDYTRKLEDVLTSRVSRILEPVVGSKNFKAEVSADVDFTVVEETEEIYNPDLPAVRSEQTLDELTSDKINGGIPGALSNQPPGKVTVPETVDGANGEDGPPLKRKSEINRNYELDRTMSHTQHQIGRLKRLTVAVVINDVGTLNPQTGQVEARQWTEVELQRLTILVRDAVGYDASRGDSINVINSPFVESAIEELEPIPFWTQPWFWEILKQILAGCFMMVLVFGVIKPAAQHLIGNKQEEDNELYEGNIDGIDDDGFGDDQVTLTGAEEYYLPSASKDYERQLDVLKGLIAEDPGRVSMILRKWIMEDAAE